MSFSTCMICFAENVKMFDVLDTHLQSVYEKLTDYEIQNDVLHLCFICHTRLRQFHQLFELALKLSRNPQEDGNEVQHKSILELSKINVANISVPCNMAIKEEPNIEQEKDIKQELDIKKEPDVKQNLDIIQENVNDQVRAISSKSVAKAVNVKNYKEENNMTLQCLKEKNRMQRVPKFEKMRCLNCRINIQRLRRHNVSSLPLSVQNRLVRWIDTELQLDEHICHPCLILLNTEAAQNERLFGHGMVCFGCGKSLKRIRFCSIDSDNPLMAVILSWDDQQTDYWMNKCCRLCRACWTKAYRLSIQNPFRH